MWLRDAIDEGGIHDVEAFAAAEQRGLRRPGERGQRGNRDIDRLMMRAADRDADPVQQRPHAFFADICRQVVISGRDNITGERFGDVLQRARDPPERQTRLRSLGKPCSMSLLREGPLLRFSSKPGDR